LHGGCQLNILTCPARYFTSAIRPPTKSGPDRCMDHGRSRRVRQEACVLCSSAVSGEPSVFQQPHGPAQITQFNFQLGDHHSEPGQLRPLERFHPLFQTAGELLENLDGVSLGRAAMDGRDQCALFAMAAEMPQATYRRRLRLRTRPSMNVARAPRLQLEEPSWPTSPRRCRAR
jgi:hypothetical protein